MKTKRALERIGKTRNPKGKPVEEDQKSLGTHRKVLELMGKTSRHFEENQKSLGIHRPNLEPIGFVTYRYLEEV
eukprot:4668271-Amphidinium_carterae.2